MSQIRGRLESFFRAGLAAVDPAAAIRRVVDTQGGELAVAGRLIPPSARIIALAVGKAARSMAGEFESIVGARISAGLAVIPDGSRVSLRA